MNEKLFNHAPDTLRIPYNNFYGNKTVIWELNKILSTLEELMLGPLVASHI